jgi:YfiR/HmsC-like
MKLFNAFIALRLSPPRWRRGLLALGLMSLWFAPAASSQELSEYRLKAAFLYNFAAFTEWPAQVGSVLNLCVYGRDPFGTEIDGLNGKSIGQRKLVVQRKAGAGVLKDCQIVFISAADMEQLPRLLDALRGLPVLTVTESRGAARQGAALNMNLAQGKVTFEANLVAARAVGLNLSSRMLSLATEVIQ